MKIKFNIPLKLRLFLPVSFIIIAVVITVTAVFISSSIRTFDEQIRNNLELEIKTISQMFERESILKLEKVQTNLKVVHDYFYQSPLTIQKLTSPLEVENQENGFRQTVNLRKWIYNGKELLNNTVFVDHLAEILGGTITIFQRSDAGFIRISTNVRKADGARAVGTFIPNSSPVVVSVLKGEIYYGRAKVVDEWYTTAYEPIVVDGKTVGMLYVGDKEKDLDELKKILSTLKIGKSGYPFVYNNKGTMLIHPYLEGGSWHDSSFFIKMQGTKEGIFQYTKGDRHKTVAYRYFGKFELYIAASIVPAIENRDFVAKVIRGAAIVAIATILLLLFLIYRFTTERLHYYFSEWQMSKKKLATAELALKHSEKLANMGQISAGIAHELNNPLGVITMYSHIILDELKEDNPMKKDVELIVEQANRCKNIVSGLLNFARKNKLSVEELNVADFMKRSLSQLVIPANVKCSVVVNTPNPMAMIDADQMLQAVTNLEKNAVEAMPYGGELTISVDGDNDMIQITITDTGTGIAKENIDKLFTPFFTTKETGKGTGLGLPLVYGIVKIHKGKIAVNSNNDPKVGKTGTEFIITIPRIN